MGLLSGRKNDPAVGAQPSHRYETRSRGGLFSGNKKAGPGTTAGANTNTVGTNSGGGLFGRKNKNAVAVNNSTGTGTGGMTTTGRTGGVGGPGVQAGSANNTGSANNQMYPGSTPSSGHAHTQITKGKIEAGIGKVTGSTNLKSKGLAKIEAGEQERISAGHLADADRLENAALDKRNMAGVQPGIHSTAGNVRGGLRH